VGVAAAVVCCAAGSTAVDPAWAYRIASVTVDEVEPASAPVATRRLFEELAREVLAIRGYDAAGGEPDARLRIRLEDWQSAEDGTVYLRARLALLDSLGGGELWSAASETASAPVPGDLRAPAELAVRRPAWEVAVERVLMDTLQRLPRRPSGEPEEARP